MCMKNKGFKFNKPDSATHSPPNKKKINLGLRQIYGKDIVWRGRVDGWKVWKTIVFWFIFMCVCVYFKQTHREQVHKKIK